MRNAPRIWRGGSKGPRRTAPHKPPQCREVPVEVMGVGPGLQRIDIVADVPLTLSKGLPPPVPEGDRWETIEDALSATTGPTRPDPWDRLTR